MLVHAHVPGAVHLTGGGVPAKSAEAIGDRNASTTERPAKILRVGTPAGGACRKLSTEPAWPWQIFQKRAL